MNLYPDYIHTSICTIIYQCIYFHSLCMWRKNYTVSSFAANLKNSCWLCDSGKCPKERMWGRTHGAAPFKDCWCRGWGCSWGACCFRFVFLIVWRWIEDKAMSIAFKQFPKTNVVTYHALTADERPSRMYACCRCVFEYQNYIQVTSTLLWFRFDKKMWDTIL